MSVRLPVLLVDATSVRLPVLVDATSVRLPVLVDAMSVRPPVLVDAMSVRPPVLVDAMSVRLPVLVDGISSGGKPVIGERLVLSVRRIDVSSGRADRACGLRYAMLVPLPCSGGVTRKCGAIFQGFATCLLALGDSLSQTPAKDEGTQEIDSICRSWDEFHSCANTAMAGCPEDAAAVWESLRQESKKMQFSGNLYDMCTKRSQQLATTAAQNPQNPANPDETNQESLKGHATRAHPASHALLSSCAALLLLLPLGRI
ncbi:hypothetical protein ACEWY4_011421 [Coilia grayii]|uniref:Neuritin-like protein n=1 Tax=Coilia grayii TaxID=363190 RepID=A0ABD1K4P2_9TELE